MNDLCSLFRFGWNVTVRRRISVKAERPGKKVPHGLLLVDRKLIIREGTCRTSRCAGKRRAHRFFAYSIRGKVAGLPHGHFHFPERLKDGRVIFAAQKRGIDFGRDEWMDLAFGQQVGLSVAFEIIARRALLSAPGNNFRALVTSIRATNNPETRACSLTDSGVDSRALLNNLNRIEM